jgi:hypothetical protein
LTDLSDGRKIEAAAAALRATIEADANFSLAYAQLSMLHTQAYAWAYDHSAERLALAKQYAETAVRLQPTLAEAQLSMAVYYNRGLGDRVRALPFFEKSLAAMPGNADVLYEFAAMERSQGKWNEAAEKFEHVAEMEPLDPLKQFNAASTYFYMRRYEDAWRILQSAMSRLPDHPALKQLKGNLFLAWKKDLGPKREEIATRSPSSPDPDYYLFEKIELLLIERKFDDALVALRQSNFALAEGGTTYWTRDALEAEILTEAGRLGEAAPISQRVARDLAHLVAARPTDARVRLAYALALAGGGGDPDNAVLQAKTAAKDVSIELDAMNGTFYQAGLALVYLRTGQKSAAAEIVTRLKRNPSIYPDWYFTLSPAWELLTDGKPPTEKKP